MGTLRVDGGQTIGAGRAAGKSPGAELAGDDPTRCIAKV
jgi:hypothetical protein